MDISALRERSSGSISVTELNNYVKNLLDSNRLLSAVSVSGEISNFTDHRSGHMYFSLKDSDSQIKAVMFRSSRQWLKFMPEEGMKVTAFGTVSVYPQTGTVQLYVSRMSPDGVGELYKAYEQLKEKLEGEGLFLEEHKRLLPRFPTKIGVITSPTGAAVRDIINVTKRRFPLADIYLYPSLVQGDGAEENLIQAVDYFDKSALADVVIIGRGGGSIEDLWAFNSERLARRIFEASVPIISAVGHETDFTICDFVSDLRAPTPSAAAEIAVPDIRDIFIDLDNKSDRAAAALLRLAERKRTRLEYICDKSVFKDSKGLLDGRYDAVSDCYEQAKLLIKDKLCELATKIKIEGGRLNALSPLAVLSRGYSVVTSESGAVKDSASVKVGDDVRIRFMKGEATAKITETKES